MEKNIEILRKKCRNKKVIFYCIGSLFEEISQDFPLEAYFDIDSVCDVRYEYDKHEIFPSISPKELKNRKFDCLIIVSADFKLKEKYLKKHNLIDKKIKIYNIFQRKIKVDVAKNYKLVQKRIKEKNKIRVLFCCEQNEKWSYTRLYESLRQSPNFEVLPVVLFPVVSKGKMIFTQKQNEEFFKKNNIETLDGWDYFENKIVDIKTFEPDIVFYQQPWYLNNCNNPKIVSKYALTIMAPYGYTTLSEKEWGSESVKETYRNLWLFLAESPYHIKYYKKTAKMKNNLVAFGSLKFDNYKEIKEYKNEKPIIIYAPHYTISNDGLRMSTFQNNYKEFLSFAKNNKQYNFVFKPHPLLSSAVLEHNLMSESEYKKYVDDWANLENAEVCLDGNYFEIFKKSDILITDCSSFLAEYYPTKKPIIFLNRKDRVPFDEFGNKIKKGFYFTHNFEEAVTCAKSLLENNVDPLLNAREQILKKHFYFDDKYVSDRIVEKLQSLFE